MLLLLIGISCMLGRKWSKVNTGPEVYNCTIVSLFVFHYQPFPPKSKLTLQLIFKFGRKCSVVNTVSKISNCSIVSLYVFHLKPFLPKSNICKQGSCQPSLGYHWDALFANIRLWWKWLPVTNTLAYNGAIVYPRACIHHTSFSS